jgi:riboflavin-specific deaminase-like protein
MPFIPLSVFNTWRLMHVFENPQIIYFWQEDGNVMTLNDDDTFSLQGVYVYPVVHPDQVRFILSLLSRSPHLVLWVGYDPDQRLSKLPQVKVCLDPVPFYIHHQYGRYEHQKMLNDRPYITLSFGSSLDGKIATHTGDSKYISSDETREFVHHLRHEADAILIGRYTVEADNPSLTTRLGTSFDRSPKRVILDRNLSLSLHYQVFVTAKQTPTYVVCEHNVDQNRIDALKNLGVHILQIDALMSQQGLITLMQRLKQEGIHQLLVEGGGTTHFSFIQHNLFDDIFAQISPLIIGGKNAKTAVEGDGFSTLKDAKVVAFKKYFQIGSDIIIFAVNKTHFIKDYHD